MRWGQSASFAGVHPGAQHPSPGVHVAIGAQLDGAPGEASLHLAVSRAAVVVRIVAVVTRFATLDGAVAAPAAEALRDDVPADVVPPNRQEISRSVSGDVR